MDDSARLVWNVEVSRRQRRWALLPMGVFFALAIGGAWEDWSRGHWGPGSVAMLLLRLIQGLAFWQIGLGLDAKVLIVERGTLEVTTRFRRPFRGPQERLPIREAALEWIGDLLVLQTPEDGGQLRLGQGPEARPLAEWLVAQGAPHPVGG